jgi:hypothetical protein
MIEEFFLPDRARPAQENIDFPGQDSLDSMHDLGKAEVPSLRDSQWAFQMRITWHDHSSGPLSFSMCGSRRRSSYFGCMNCGPVGPPDRAEDPVPHLLAKLLSQQLIHHLRIGLTLRRLHHLADKEARNRLLPGAVLFHLLRIGGDDLINDLLQG